MEPYAFTDKLPPGGRPGEPPIDATVDPRTGEAIAPDRPPPPTVKHVLSMGYWCKTAECRRWLALGAVAAFFGVLYVAGYE